MQRKAEHFYIFVYAFIAITLLSGILIILKKQIELYSIQKSVRQNYRNHAKILIPGAIQYLQNNQNDWMVCTDLGLSLQNIDDPKTMAAWIAYYQYGKTYCSQWWNWPNNDPCGYMQQQEKNVTNNDKVVLLKKITLCMIAKEREKQPEIE